ncbi:MAG: bifunctional diguanylate cyclase/phosphodiesterase [Oceanospirillaceae bacterium]|nr:bifunctional diguanylate cyclase/phosphodiesterase [Oceanospirillaceae bacterium]
MRSLERRTMFTKHEPPHSVSGVTPVENLLLKPLVPVFLAVLVGLLLLIASSTFISILNDKQSALDKIAVMSQVQMVERQLVKFMITNSAILHQFHLAVVSNDEMTEEHFRDIAEPLAQRYPDIKLITLSRQGVINNVYPLGLNQDLMGKKISSRSSANGISGQGFYVEYSQGTSTQQTNVVLNQQLFAVEVSGGTSDLLSIELDFYHYLRSQLFLDNSPLQAFSIVSLPGGERLFQMGSQSTSQQGDAYALSVDIAGGTWRIETSVKNRPFTEQLWSWLGAVLFSILMSVITYRIICAYRQRSVDVQAGAYRANFDILTSLPNRYHFSRRLRELIDEAQRDQTDFAVFFMDIDHFKHINDQLGQGAGDVILTEFSARLALSAKSTDLIARISGDEFVFVARDVDDVIKADLLADKLKKHLQQPIEFAGQQHFLTISMGVAMYPIDGDDAPTLLHHSDQAMYAAKNAGRNRHFFFNEGMREQAESFLNLHQDLLRGLEAGEFELYYQPVLNVKTDQVDICEALIRWNHPEKGLVMPDKFIAVAERTGAIREIGNWAFGQACRDIRRFDEGDINIKIAINHSISEYYSNRAFERWKRILRENFVTGDRFIFEIPEALLMDKKSIRINVVNAMRKMGVQFAIDDFGTGHSAINYLRNYPAEILKIDASLIQGMQTNSQDRTLVEVVLTLAKSLGKVVVAEGVESEEVAALLKALNCDYLQGNWLLEPKPINRLIPYLHQHMFELEERIINTNQ